MLMWWVWFHADGDLGLFIPYLRLYWIVQWLRQTWQLLPEVVWDVILAAATRVFWR